MVIVFRYLDELIDENDCPQKLKRIIYKNHDNSRFCLY